MSAHIQQALQETVILATGRAANATELALLEEMISRSDSYDTVVSLVNEYMSNLVTQQGELATLQAVVKNGHGVVLSTAQATQLNSDLKAQGIDTWAKIFEFSITLQSVDGATLDNRALAANDFLKSLDAADKSDFFTGSGVNSAVKTMLQNIGSSTTDLTNGYIGFDALASKLTATGIKGTVSSVGYVTGATVFADTNHDGILNVGEWSTTTDIKGQFELPNNIATDKIIAFGGTDIMTGNAFQGVLSSFAGGTVLNPLTTMIEAMVASGQVGTVAEATTAVRSVLSLPQNVNLLSYDPLLVLASTTATTADKTVALAVQTSVQQIANILTQIAAVINAASADTSIQSATAVANALVNAIIAAAGTVAGSLDLTSANVLSSIIQAATAALGSSTISIQQVGQIAQVIAASNASAAAATDITELTQAANISQGGATTALVSGAIRSDYTSAVSGFTGAALKTANLAATVGFFDLVVPVPPPPSADDTPAPLVPIAPTGLSLASAGDSGISNTDNLTRNTTGLTISGSAEANATVRIYDTDGTTLLGTGTATGGTFSIVVTLTEGVHSITAKTTNAGNITGAASNALLITVDTTAPSASIVLADAELNADGTSLVTITFTEAVTGFTNADLTITNGTLTNVVSVDGGVTWTASFTPAVGITNATNVITLANSGVTDLAGNAGAGTTNSNTYAIDTLRPTATIVVADDALKAGETSLVTITFNEAVNGFTNSDLTTIENGILSPVGSIDGGITWTATFTPTTDITSTSNLITLSNTGVLDSAGNTGVGTTNSNTYAIDTLRPTATIVVSDTALAAGESSLVTITFNEAVNGFSNADLSIANGTLTDVSSLDNITWTATFTPTIDITNTSNIITLTNSGVTDLAGNAGAGTTNSNTYAIDTLRPTATIVVADDALKAGDTSLVTVTFTEAVTDFTNADLTTIENGILTDVISADGGITWTATFTPTTDITVTSNVITLTNSGVTDLAGNAGTGSTNSNNYSIDTLRPVATIVVSDTALAFGETSLVTITFTEAVSDFTNADLSIANGTLTDVISADGGITWTATFTPTADVTNTTNFITLTNTGVTDLAGNAGIGTTNSNNYEIDTLQPTATIVVADNALKAGETSLVTVTFTEAVTDFTNADLTTIENGTLTDVISADGGITWTATFTPTADVTNTTNFITLTNTGVTDLAGNAGIGTTNSNNYAIDTLRPTATIAVSDAALAVGETSLVTITFNEAVTSFTNTDLTTIENGTLTDVISTDGGITWTSTFTPTVDVTNTTNFITLTNSGVTDLAGNAGISTINSNNYAIDTLRPSATILVTDSALKVGETSLVTITFNEAVTDFTNSDLTAIDNGTLSTISSGDGGISWTATFTPSVDITDTTNAITLTNTGVTDLAGNAGIGTTNSNNYAIDTLRPTATIVVSDAALAAGETSLVTITFNEAVTGFTNTDLTTIENGTLTDVISADGGITWTATFTPSSDITDTTNAITLTNTGVTDLAGNAGTGTTNSNNYAIDTLRPTATIVVDNSALKAGETSLVTITFNEAVTDFTNSDLTTIANGTLTDVISADGDITWTSTLTPTADVTDTTNLITLTNSGVTDLAGNAGSGTTNSNNYAIDTLRPTATIVVSDAALAAGETSLVTIAFSEAVADFTNADLTTIENGTLSAVDSVDGGITWTATFTPTADITDASNVITLDNTGVLDAAGNAGIGSTNSNNYAIDTLRPTATIVVSDAALAIGQTSLVTITFNEVVTDFTNADLTTIENGTLSAVDSVDGGITWTATFTPTADITDTSNVITLDNTGVLDAAGNAGVGTTNSNNYAIDTLRPTATIVVSDAALAIGQTSLVTITFNEAVTDFTNSDLTAIDKGTLSTVSSGDGGISWTATFTPTVDITDTSNVITLDNTGVVDVSGNAGVGTTISNNYAIDTLAPTVTINVIASDDTINAAEVGSVISGTTETGATVSLNIGGTSRAATVTDTTWSYTLVAADITTMGEGAETIVATATDAAGNSTDTTRDIQIDTLAPTATIVLDDTALKVGETSGVTITFTEAVTDFTNADLSIANGTLTDVASSDNIIWTATFTPNANVTNTTNVITLTNTGVLDAAGNAGTGTTDSNNYEIDTLAPTITINVIASDDTINAAEVGSVISGTTEALATVSLSIGGTQRAATVTGTSWTYTLVAADITNMGEGAETITATATDAAGNTADTTRDIQIDTLAPTATIVLDDTALKVGETSGVTITFTEAVTDFTNADLSIANGTLTDVASSDNIIWTAIFTPNASVTDTTNIITLDNTGVLDAAGNAGVGTTDSNNYAIDTSAPTLTLSSPLDEDTLVLVNSNIVLTFSENVAAGSGNIVISDGTDIRNIAAGNAQVTISGTTVTINPTTHLNPNALYNIQMAAGVLLDAAGNSYAGIIDATTLNFATGTDTLTIIPGAGNLTLADSFWTDKNGIDKIVITTTGTGTQTITTAGIFQTVFAEGVELTTISSTGTIDIDMSSFSGAATLTTTSSTGNQTINTGSGADVVTVLTSAATGNVITTGDGNDIITIINTGAANGSAYSITGGLGADIINLDLAQVSPDTIVIGDADSGISLITADTITGFVGTQDRLKMGTAGSAGNYIEAGAAVADFDAALAAANLALATLNASAEQYSFQWDATNGYLFNDTNGDNIADQVVVLVGVIGAEFALEYIIA